MHGMSHPAMHSPRFFRTPQSFMQIHAREQTPVGGGLYAQGRGILDEKFSINDIKNTGRQLFGRGVLDERFSVNDVIRTGKDLFGRGFSKKQLNDIIHHKNKVISDLEEEAYDPPSKTKGGRLKKGSAEAKAHMAKIRKMRGGRIPAPPSRSPITDPSLL